MPNACATRAIWPPILPSPSSPSVFPCRVTPRSRCHGPLFCSPTLSGTICFANPSSSAGQLHRRRRPAAGAAHHDAALGGGGQIDRSVAHAGGDQQLQLRQPRQQRGGHRRALAHDDQNVALLQMHRQLRFIGKVRADGGHLHPIGQRRPVRHLERHLLVIIENCALQFHLRLPECRVSHRPA